MVAELKPSTANAKLLLASSSAGTTAGKIGSVSGTSDFVLKLWAMDSDDYSPDEEATGDGDDKVKFVNSGWLYNDTVLHGCMVASVAIGIANIIDAAKNPTAAAVSMLLSSNRQMTRILLIRRIRVRWHYRAAIARVSMITRMTGTTTSTIEGAVT